MEAVGSSLAWAATRFSGVSAAFGAAMSAAGSSPPWARSRSSGVRVHRQWKSESPSPVMPPVRTSVHPPHATRMVATIDARRGPSERRRPATAHATKARLTTGMARTGNSIPMPPFASDTWMKRDVANSATTISTMAPKRSDQGARLKNAHHTTTASPPTRPPINPTGGAPGPTTGTTNLNSTSSAPAITPGHSRSGF